MDSFDLVQLNNQLLDLNQYKNAIQYNIDRYNLYDPLMANWLMGNLDEPDDKSQLFISEMLCTHNRMQANFSKLFNTVKTLILTFTNSDGINRANLRRLDVEPVFLRYNDIINDKNCVTQDFTTMIKMSVDSIDSGTKKLYLLVKEHIPEHLRQNLDMYFNDISKSTLHRDQHGGAKNLTDIHNLITKFKTDIEQFKQSMAKWDMKSFDTINQTQSQSLPVTVQTESELFIDSYQSIKRDVPTTLQTFELDINKFSPSINHYDMKDLSSSIKTMNTQKPIDNRELEKTLNDLTSFVYYDYSDLDVDDFTFTDTNPLLKQSEIYNDKQDLILKINKQRENLQSINNVIDELEKSDDVMNLVSYLIAYRSKHELPEVTNYTDLYESVRSHINKDTVVEQIKLVGSQIHTDIVSQLLIEPSQLLLKQQRFTRMFGKKIQSIDELNNLRTEFEQLFLIDVKPYLTKSKFRILVDNRDKLMQINSTFVGRYRLMVDNYLNLLKTLTGDRSQSKNLLKHLPNSLADLLELGDLLYAKNEAEVLTKAKILDTVDLVPILINKITETYQFDVKDKIKQVLKEIHEQNTQNIKELDAELDNIALSYDQPLETVESIDSAIVRIELKKLFSLLNKISTFNEKYLFFKEFADKPIIDKSIEGGGSKSDDIKSAIENYETNYQNVISSLFDNINDIEKSKKNELRDKVKLLLEMAEGVVFFTGVVLENKLCDSQNDKICSVKIQYIDLNDIRRLKTLNTESSDVQGVLVRIGLLVDRIEILATQFEEKTKLKPLYLKMDYRKRSFVPLLLLQTLIK